MSLTKKSCLFCQHHSSDDLKMGKLYVYENIVVHYYCLLFSSGLEQKGSPDNDGIVGFLPKDILHEVQRGKRLKCSFCKKTGATIGCCSLRCRKVFHLPCGQQMDALQQFYGTFSSFCSEHRPRQKIPFGELESMTQCMICFANIDRARVNHIIFPPCCRNGLFHRLCVQKQAISSGCFFFRCPLCNNKDKFQEEMLLLGVYIPEQDAAWELENNAFQDLYVRHSRCDLERCRCPEGRTRNDEDGVWQIILCTICGSQGCHAKCGNIGANMNYECKECIAISQKVTDKSISEKSPRTVPSPNIRKEEIRNTLETTTMSLQQFLDGHYVLHKAPLIFIASDEESDGQEEKRYTAKPLLLESNDESACTTSEDSQEEKTNFERRTRILRSRHKRDKISLQKQNGLERIRLDFGMISSGPSSSGQESSISINKDKMDSVGVLLEKAANSNIGSVSGQAALENEELKNDKSTFATSKPSSSGLISGDNKDSFLSKINNRGRNQIELPKLDPVVSGPSVSALVQDRQNTNSGNFRLTRGRNPSSTQNGSQIVPERSGLFDSVPDRPASVKKSETVHVESKQRANSSASSLENGRLESVNSKPTAMRGPLSKRSKASRELYVKDESQTSILNFFPRDNDQGGTRNAQPKMCVMTFREDSRPSLRRLDD